ncbi:MAG: SRPBCC domain-containing protein [Anaerolineae bacterium]|nr:SRPBCC domain-containing protein [Anaerolineae bacterium]
MNRIIHQRALLRCDVRRAFEMFTVNEAVQSWLAPQAEIEPRQGGKYELFWDVEKREDDSTIGCKVTAIEQDRFLSFEWKGPTQYRHFMNDADPLTHVVVFFVPSMEASPPETEVFLFHTGWRSSGEWEEARQWFDRAWRVALEQLEHQVNTGSL